jgi:hypothetical protein
MELYPAPGQNSIPVPNSLQLALHETVHVKQMRALETGFSGTMSILTGQQFTGIVSALLPLWFFEGDAVIYETLLSPGGRGINPSFNNEMKAIAINNPALLGYDKMLLGSYRNHTPDYYRYGFRLMEYSRSMYGNDLWKKAVSNTARKPYIINPVNSALRKSASLTKNKLFGEAFSEYNKLWSHEMQLEAPLQYTSINPDKKGNYINYHSPVQISNDSIIAIKTSLYDPPSIVLITKAGSREERVLYAGRIYPYLLSASSGKLVWAESQPDPRWENRDYSVIRTYNLSTGLPLSITSRTRYFAPALSPDGNLIATVENTPAGKNYLVFLNTATGSTVTAAATPGNGYPQRPMWSDNGSEVTVIMLSDSGEGIYTYSIDEERWTMLLEPGREDLQSAVVRNDTTFFISSAGGTDNIFCKTSDGTFYRITRSRFGTGSFSLNANNLLFSDYDHNGYSIARCGITAEPFDYGNRSPLPSFLMGNIVPPSASGEVTAIPEITPADTGGLEITPFRKWKNLFNIHSWAPFYYDIEEIASDPLAISPGITLLSQNLLSTLVSSVGYEYEAGEHILHSGITWKGWYPVVNFRMSYGGEPLIITGNESGVVPSVISPALNTSAEMYLPLRYSAGSYNIYLRPSLGHRYNNRYIYDDSREVFDYGQSFVTGRLYLSGSRLPAYRDIFPRIAQSFDLAHTAAPFDSDIYGPITSIRTTFYFPGIIRNHGLRIRLQGEKQKPEKFINYNRIDFPRGYNNIFSILNLPDDFGQIISEKLRTITADYVFPIAYPDVGIRGIIYFKRVRGTLFADYSRGWNNRHLGSNTFVEGWETYSSAGAEFLTDLNLFRIPFDITAGVRGGIIPRGNLYFLEAVFSVDVYGFSIGNRDRKRLPLL